MSLYQWDKKKTYIATARKELCHVAGFTDIISASQKNWNLGMSELGNNKTIPIVNVFTAAARRALVIIKSKCVYVYMSFYMSFYMSVMSHFLGLWLVKNIIVIEVEVDELHEGKILSRPSTSMTISAVAQENKKNNERLSWAVPHSEINQTKNCPLLQYNRGPIMRQGGHMLQNGRQGLERGVPLGFWALPSTFAKYRVFVHSCIS